MKAAVLLPDKPGDLAICQVKLDRPAPNEVVVRSVASGLCHSDLHVIDGDYSAAGRDLAGGMVLGHEVAGIVEEIGSDVRYVHVGDHVVTFPLQFCGVCVYCLRGSPTLCNDSPGARAGGEHPRILRGEHEVFQFNNLGGFAERLLVNERGLVRLDPEYPLERAAIIGCAVATGYGGVAVTAGVRPGSSVVVLGLGGVGLAAVQAAVVAGAARIIAMDTEVEKLDLARKCGATDCLDASVEDPVSAVIELTDGGVDYAFEAIGLKTTIEQSVRMLGRGGTATVLGIGIGQQLQLDAGLFVYERRLQGSLMGSARSRIDLPHIVQLDTAGRLNLQDLIDQYISLDEINDGFEAMRRRQIVGRRVIRFPQ